MQLNRNDLRCITRELYRERCEETTMNRMAMLGALLLTAGSAVTPALGQAVAPLSYVQPLTPAATRDVQDRLRQLGAYSGNVDGIWGRDSQLALERFQR